MDMIINFSKDRYEKYMNRWDKEKFGTLGTLEGEMVGSLYQGALCCEAVLYFDDETNKYYIGGDIYVLDPEANYGEINGIKYESCDGFCVDICDTYEHTLNNFIHDYNEFVNKNNYLMDAIKNKTLTWEKLNLSVMAETDFFKYI